ncbi:MAG: hypothetical protein AB7H97_14640 [Pseudobdellovibrionaceae bacterium]
MNFTRFLDILVSVVLGALPTHSRDGAKEETHNPDELGKKPVQLQQELTQEKEV